MANKVTMPKLSDTMEEGTILNWYMEEGDQVESGDAIAEVETDKAVMDLQAFSSGVLRKRFVEAGQAVPVGQLIAVLGEADEDIGAIVAEAGGSAAEPAAEQAPKPEDSPAPESASETMTEASAPAPELPADAPEPAAEEAPAEPPPAPEAPDEEKDDGRIKATPAARKLAEERGVDLSAIQGSGPDGRIVEKDIPSAEGAPAAPKSPPKGQPSATEVKAAPGEVKDLSQMRKAIVRQMAKSKAPVPHFYLTMEIAMEKAMEVVAEVKETHPEIKIGINDLIVKASAEALKKFPQLNSSYVEENKVKTHASVDIGIAVGLEDGLITPVIRDCAGKAIRTIATESREMVERARKRALKPEEYTGATFTISNLGMFGVESFVAVINPPEAAILAVAAVRDVPVVENGHIAVGKRMLVTLSCDHRVVDGMQGAQFLQEFRHLMENPVGLVV